MKTAQFLPLRAQRERVEVVFQGSLVKVRFPSVKSNSSSVPDDSRWHKRAYSFALSDAIKSKLVRSEQLVYSNDGVFLGVSDLSEIQRQAIERRQQALAFELKQNYSKGKRGIVRNFSRRSRNRALELGATLREDAWGLFVTCTYRENFRRYKLAKLHLKKLTKWLRYHYPACAVMWRMENQRRGAIHFHLLIFNVSFIPAAELTAYWQKISGDDSYPDIKRIHNRKNAVSYIAKYVAKEIDETSYARVYDWRVRVPRLLDLSVYHIGRKMKKWSKRAAVTGANSVGRYWGVVGRVNLPVADKTVFSGEIVMRSLLEFRRAAARLYPRCRTARVVGFTLYTRDIESWRKYWDYCTAHLRYGINRRYQTLFNPAPNVLQT